VQKLIAMGATNIVVPGVLPIGCFPIYLTIYQSSNSSDYDDLGCLHNFNDLSTYHNTLLQRRVDIIQSRHRKTARIMYADFYSGVYDMVRNPQNYGASPKFSQVANHIEVAIASRRGNATQSKASVRDDRPAWRLLRFQTDLNRSLVLTL